MKIGPVDSGERPIRPDEDENRRVELNSDTRRRTDDTDRVEISPVARELSEQAAASAEETNRTEEVGDSRLRREKIEQARQRAETGYYDSPAVRGEVARRITDDFLR
jgi:hypothetical protein